jgi:hypothetical protein
MALTAVYKYPENGRGPETELEVGKEYSVIYVDMGQSYTSIWLEGLDPSFNSVQFEFYEDGKPIDIYRSPKYNPYIRKRKGVDQ